MASGQANSSWTFLTNHTHVLIALVRNPDSRLREVAVQVGITERMVQKIVNELVRAGVVTRQRIGRANSYEVNLEVRLRHPLEATHTVGDLLDRIKSD